MKQFVVPTTHYPELKMSLSLMFMNFDRIINNNTPTARFKIRSGDKQGDAILWQTPELVKSFENTGWGLLYSLKTNKFAVTPPDNRNPREQK